MKREDIITHILLFIFTAGIGNIIYLIYTCSKKEKNKREKTLYNNTTTNETINYDEIFKDCEDIAFLKYNGKLNDYVNLKNKKKFSENDIMWGIYCNLKLEYELKKEYNNLANILSRQGRLLVLEKKYTEALKYCYCELYCSKFLKVENPHFDIGSTRARDINNLLKFTNSKFTFDDFYNSLMEILPSLYNDKIAYLIFEKSKEMINL